MIISFHCRTSVPNDSKSSVIWPILSVFNTVSPLCTSQLILERRKSSSRTSKTKASLKTGEVDFLTTLVFLRSITFPWTLWRTFTYVSDKEMVYQTKFNQDRVNVTDDNSFSDHSHLNDHSILHHTTTEHTHCTAPYRTLLHCTTLHRTVPYCAAPHRTLPYLTAPHCTVPQCTVLYRTILHRTAMHRTTQHCTTRTAPHHTVPHCTVPHCVAPPCTAPHCTAPYYNVDWRCWCYCCLSSWLPIAKIKTTVAQVTNTRIH